MTRILLTAVKLLFVLISILPISTLHFTDSTIAIQKVFVTAIKQ